MPLRVRQAGNVHAFFKRVQRFLLGDEAAHNLLFGILAFLREQPNAANPPWLFTVEDKAIACVAIRTPPQNLMLSQVDDLAALAALAKKLYAKGMAPPGVLGPKEAARAFSESWRLESGQTYEFKMAQRIYQLEHVTTPPGVSGSFQQASESERDLLTRWCAAFNLEALGEAPDNAKAERVIRSYLKGGKLFLWRDGGKVVSMAGASGPTPNGMRVNLVYTPPEWRGRGYASACVAALSARLLKDHRYCFLFTDLTNATSNHIYQSIGYRAVCDVDSYRFLDTVKPA